MTQTGTKIKDNDYITKAYLDLRLEEHETNMMSVIVKWFERFDKKVDKIGKDLEEFKDETRENFASVHRRIDGETLRTVKQDQHEALERRVGTIEKKVGLA